MSNGENRIEILSVDLLKNKRSLVDRFAQLSLKLDKGLGWHYLLDLTWVASQLELFPRMQVLDAGAGVGIMQWWLADQGVNVVSADRVSRYNIPDRFREEYRIKGWRRTDLASVVRFYDFLPPRSLKNWHTYPQKFFQSCQKLIRSVAGLNSKKGVVFIYNTDLSSLSDLPDASVNAIVSISSLEHNSPSNLKNVVIELMRVLKPGGKLISTLGAARGQDWFHEPSQGWCYTDITLRDVFDLSTDCLSNFDQYDELFDALKNCDELRNGLADFYFKSGNNGMPWGIWDPKYQTVGIVKVKDK